MAFEFIAALHITQGILSYIELISVSLQGNNQDVIKETTEVQEVIRALQEQRDNSDTFHEKIYSCIVSTAESVNVEQGAPRLVAGQRHRANVPATTPAEYYKVNVTISILDEIFPAMNDRFGPEATFTNLFILMQLLCTVGLTTCEWERNITVLRKLEPYMRTTMAQERINGLALMHVHYGLDIDIQWVIDEFARRNPRRMNLINVLAD
ncbi:hypothetical protein LSH36_266g00001 [Paralvinella palmiformis]|uniref:Uncharacterized protein n=1 Tax=Paralvinella palmiformis TaxID=53620 RepID=A0AAD9JK45_9ANNE|nr:hypothetical protein LSH36_266g00001 [Paralvinella palmiformis]